jgi:LacI family transcriptional regulator
MHKKTSIHDIAKHLNISATTVSFVLNGKAEERKISVAMKKKILGYVKEIGYRPNSIAQSLRTGKTKIIGMLVEDISDPFFSSIARIIEENLYKCGYKIFHSSTDNNTQRTKALLQILRESQVDGYIIAPAPGIEDDIRELINDSKPVILFDRYFPTLNTTNVVVNNMAGTYEAAQHLVQNNFTNIGFVTLESNQVQMADRLKGYMKAMNKNKFQKYILKIVYKTDPAEITLLIKKFLLKNKEINALLFATNYLAISGLKAIRELGLKVPEDIGIVGFDDNTHFSLFSPSITAAAQPVEEISTETVKELIKVLTIEEKIKKKKTIVLQTKLIVRESSASRIDFRKTK